MVSIQKAWGSKERFIKAAGRCRRIPESTARFPGFPPGDEKNKAPIRLQSGRFFAK
tara:strand:- start:30 stop:197 length:168 start_codon:yes stop_codon:yes gene_type:complete